MKKILIVFASLAFFSAVYAQKFEGGITVGFSGNQVDGDDLSGYNKIGLIGGVAVKRNLSDSWAALMEIRFDGKGAMHPETKDDPKVYNLKLQFVDVPILAQYKANRVLFEAGLSFGYLFNAKFNEGEGFFNPKEDYHSFESSLLLGVGYKISDHITGKVRFAYSLTPIYGIATNAHMLFNGGQYNNSLQFTLNYFF